ncbi:MAG: hypothetical protein RL069_1447, partial [Planctomycetota bacterium]
MLNERGVSVEILKAKAQEIGLDGIPEEAWGKLVKY